MGSRSSRNGNPHRLGDVAAMARAACQARGSDATGAGTSATDKARADHLDVEAQRQLVAEFCKLIGRRAGKQAATVSRAVPPAATLIDTHAPAPHLSPRERQTLDLLLRGDGEKQIAAKLKLSQHTVHIYVKALHKRFAVSSRAELLARFIPQAPAAPDSPRFK